MACICVKGSLRRVLQYVLGGISVGLLLAGCGVTQSTGSDSSQTIAIHQAFQTSGILVHTNRLSWSPNGDWVAFETGHDGMNVYKVAPEQGSTPIRVTNYDTDTWDNGGEAVSYLANGNLAYYVGWFYIADDKDMHVMVATPEQENNSPTPTVLHTFNGIDVGMTEDSAGSPSGLCMSGDGTRAVIAWGDTVYLMDWSSGPVAATLLDYATDADISRDGTYIGYVKTNGTIAYRPVAGGTETVIGAGTDPSWSNNGKLGYVTGNVYVVYDTATEQSHAYSAPDGTLLQNATLSWDATKIAFRTFSGPTTGIAIGELAD